jgi:ribonuclease III
MSEFAGDEDVVKGCEAAIGYQFNDKQLLWQCLTHTSVARTRLESNERLEFLGDAILGAVVCGMLYRNFPDETEGELTRIKSVVVSRYTCAALSEQLGLDQFLQRGKGLGTGGGIPLSMLAAVFESLVAAVYLDGGWPASQEFIERMLEPHITVVAEATHGKNFKSALQHLAQKNAGQTPAYLLLEERGPDHSKYFKVAAVLGGQTFTAAWGTNKKEAEQRAAANALAELEGRELPHDTQRAPTTTE